MSELLFKAYEAVRSKGVDISLDKILIATTDGLTSMQDIRDYINDLQSQLQAKDDRIKELTEALGFYADDSNWFNDDSSNFRLEINPEDGQEFRRPKAIYIGGKRARAALNGEK